MLKKNGHRCPSKLIRVIFLANILVWVYFAVSFWHASYAYQPDLQGDINGTGYTFWGYSIGLVESGLVYPFYRIIYFIQFPSFIVSVIVAKIFDPNLTGNWFFLGISEGGWILIGTMLLSFIQWLLVSYLIRYIFGRTIHGLKKLRKILVTQSH